MMLSWTKMFCTGESTDELSWIMNQYGQVLRANPKALTTIFKGDQWCGIRSTLTCKTLCCFLVTHCISKCSNQ